MPATLYCLNVAENGTLCPTSKMQTAKIKQTNLYHT